MKKNSFVLAMFMFTGMAYSFGQANEMQDDVNMIVKNLTDSKESIKKYEWIETTTTFVNGEQKSVKQMQCYYGVDGTLTQVETGGTTETKTPPGIRGKIVENKKEDMSDYIGRAITKIKTYIPPQADKIKQIYAAGGTAIHILEPGKKFKIDFPDYLQKGDMLSVTLDKVNKLLLGYSVNTFVDDATDKVSLDITFKTLPDGTSYAGDITFNSAGKNVKIVMANSGFKLGAGH
jgi:hypothetical protein